MLYFGRGSENENLSSQDLWAERVGFEPPSSVYYVIKQTLMTVICRLKLTRRGWSNTYDITTILPLHLSLDIEFNIPTCRPGGPEVRRHPDRN